MKKLQEGSTQEQKLLALVSETVAAWDIRFRAGYNLEQKKLIAREYTEDLISEGVNEKHFYEASLIVRRRVRFFPSMADILSAVAEYRKSHTVSINTLQLDIVTSMHDPTPEEVAINKKRVVAIGNMLAGKLSMKKALEEVEGSTVQIAGRKRGDR